MKGTRRDKGQERESWGKRQKKLKKRDERTYITKAELKESKESR